ncbi:cell wall hydrolase, partial [Thermincola ferriacetica]
APVVEAKPAPAEEVQPAPVVEAKPAPAEEVQPAPVVEAKPAPANDSKPVSDKPRQMPGDEVRPVPTHRNEHEPVGNLNTAVVDMSERVQADKFKTASGDKPRVPAKNNQSKKEPWWKRLISVVAPRENYRVQAGSFAVSEPMAKNVLPSGMSAEEQPSLWYKVRLGESLWLIGKTLGVQWQKIMEFNKLISTIIYPDQKLGIPDVPIADDGTIKYNIKNRDTLYWIGQSLGIDYREIMARNGLTDHWIYPDQMLIIPLFTEMVTEGAKNLLNSQNQALALLDLDNESDIGLLAKAVYAEARGEPFEGQVAVAAVILNRLAAPGFPKTIRDIIFQPWAFTAVIDGQINLIPDSTAYRAVEEALKGRDPSEGALYYWNPDIATSKWVWTRPITKMIGNHVFAK